MNSWHRKTLVHNDTVLTDPPPPCCFFINNFFHIYYRLDTCLVMVSLNSWKMYLLFKLPIHFEFVRVFPIYGAFSNWLTPRKIMSKCLSKRFPTEELSYGIVFAVLLLPMLDLGEEQAYFPSFVYVLMGVCMFVYMCL